jgi:transcriptional regulator with XRE-family HTH domain
MTAVEFRAALADLDLTQRSLSERLGVEKGTVNRWANGHVPVPQYVIAYLDLLADYRDQEKRINSPRKRKTRNDRRRPRPSSLC